MDASQPHVPSLPRLQDLATELVTPAEMMACTNAVSRNPLKEDNTAILRKV